MKTLAKLLSYLMPVKKYRKPFLKRLENLLWCGDYSESVCFKNPPYGEKNGQEPVCCRAEQGKPQYNVGR